MFILVADFAFVLFGFFHVFMKLSMLTGISVFLIFRNNKILLVNIFRRLFLLFEEREYFTCFLVIVLSCKYTAWTVSVEMVCVAKSRPRKNQSECSDLPCHIIRVLYIYFSLWVTC